jgi:putative transposase
MDTTNFWSGAHTKHRLKYHITFIPKYRHGVLQGEVATHAKRLFYDCAEANDWWIEELDIPEDHVHMLVRLPPRYSVPKAVQLLKGGSSKVLREEHPKLDVWLWGDSFWAEGYFAETVGRVHESEMKKYIREQSQHDA